MQQTVHLNWDLAPAFPNSIHFDPTESDSQGLFCPFLCQLFLPLVLPPRLSRWAGREELSAPVDGSSGFLGLCLPDRGWTVLEQATAVETEGCAGAQCSAPGHEFRKCGPQKCQLFL